MVLAEKETEHRIAWEKDALRANIQESKRGQILGATISFAAVAGSVASVFLGAHPAVSVALVGVPVAAIVKAIVDARSGQQR